MVAEMAYAVAVIETTELVVGAAEMTGLAVVEMIGFVEVLEFVLGFFSELLFDLVILLLLFCGGLWFPCF